MRLFWKKKKENWVLKLYKVVDLESAKEFDMEGFVLEAIEQLSSKTELKPDHFGINYRDSAKTLRKFKRSLKKHKSIVYSDVSFSLAKAEANFIISNPMLNSLEKSQKSSIDFLMQTPLDSILLDQLQLLSESLIAKFNLDYGYITSLPSNFDSSSERKFKYWFFVRGVEAKEVDHFYYKQRVYVNEGLIAKPYQINYLNTSHFNNDNIQEELINIGTLEETTNDLKKWILTATEIEILNNRSNIINISFKL